MYVPRANKPTASGGISRIGSASNLPSLLNNNSNMPAYVASRGAQELRSRAAECGIIEFYATEQAGRLLTLHVTIAKFGKDFAKQGPAAGHFSYGMYSGSILALQCIYLHAPRAPNTLKNVPHWRTEMEKQMRPIRSRFNENPMARYCHFSRK